MKIANDRQAIGRVAQSSLRETIGPLILAALRSVRKTTDEQLGDAIECKTANWGISVTSVEIRDGVIPVALQDAMWRQAQAERKTPALASQAASAQGIRLKPAA